jgi:hypothetical protein
MQLLIEDRRFYTYIYLNPLKPGKFNYDEFHFDYEPFYVGEGHNKRLYSHLELAKKKINCDFLKKDIMDDKNYNEHKINTIKKILKNNKEPIIFKLKENLTKYEAVLFEKCLIKLIGRRNKGTGPLTNLIDSTFYKKYNSRKRGNIPWNKKFINKNDIDKLCNLRNQNYSISKLSEFFSVSSNVIIRILKENSKDYTSLPKWNKGKKDNEIIRYNKSISHKKEKAYNYRKDLDDNILIIIKFKKEGKTTTEIAKIFNCSNSAIKKRIYNFNKYRQLSY